MARRIFEHDVSAFLSSPQQTIKLLYTTTHQLILPMTNRLLVLDSSFNPPHKGHYSLISKSIAHQFKDTNSQQASVSSINTKSALLLLSVKNADKADGQPASFPDRLAMMRELADEISNNLGVCCGIGITDKSLFVDKAEVLKEFLETEYQRELKLTFLLGFDTLVRLLNPKYYQPVPIADALAGFFKVCDCFILTREDGNNSIELQKSYLNQLKDGSSSSLKDCSDKFVVVDGDDSSLDISSSSIRENYKNGDANWETKTFTGISMYIKESKLYD